MTESETPLESAAESAGATVETARSLLRSLQEPAENPQLCERCGRAANAEAGHYVARVPLREGDGVRCTECFADHLEAETLLSTRQAQATAYLVATDLTYSKIHGELGTGIKSHRKRAKQKMLDSDDQLMSRLLEEL
ncbi:hypothetical protein RH831_08805 [Halodesulfurarchaeum sp. HSR-GB]|uniref:hypothetical protein n=1 Tax=Halodesulfurarchaeum sp. HSR-GB TaxID=3074077 RepID=UPI002854289C|nr:hypothetical protein [Halodesulfurarchaeum sp. HSR-GB]MDR5657278.1 hypothetical protein [Halodesulfurarchaeum sp. HSR-GB]